MGEDLTGRFRRRGLRCRLRMEDVFSLSRYRRYIRRGVVCRRSRSQRLRNHGHEASEHTLDGGETCVHVRVTGRQSGHRLKPQSSART